MDCDLSLSVETRFTAVETAAFTVAVLTVNFRFNI